MPLGALLVQIAVYLVAVFAKYIPRIIVTVLTFFGVKYATKTWAIQPFEDYIIHAIGGAPAVAVQALAAVNFDQAVTIILSAHIAAAAARLAFQVASTTAVGASTP